MIKRFFQSFLLLLTVSMVNSCAQNVTHDKGVMINGVKWATRNVVKPGTFAIKPENTGMFYQWNRITGWSTVDPMENSNGDTTWNSITPTGTTWEKSNDPSPTGWRVPTLDEIETLFNRSKVSNEWTTVNGVTGRKFTDKATGNSIFLPAVGYRGSMLDDVGTLDDVGMTGLYWSSAQGTGGSGFACYFYFDSKHAGWGNDIRRRGQSVHSVAE